MYADSKQKSYKITKMQLFAIYDKAKHDAENIRGLNLARSSLTAVKVAKLSL
jgi:hypothetical protein